MDHSSLVGSAREFIVKRVLRSILPPITHLGTGIVVDFQGKKSKQIDIIVYDPRFPVFEMQSGIGVYLLEGVIATIEVKSMLTKKTLYEALENTYSFLELTPGLVSSTASRWMARVKAIEAEGYSHKEAMRKAGFEFIPATYVFSFNSRLRAKGLSNSVDGWFKVKGHPVLCDDHCAVLPRVIACGNSLGLLHDGLIKIQPDPNVLSEWRKENPEPNHMMLFWDTKRRLGWLIIHLLHTVCSRIGLQHAVSGAVYGVDQYLSIEDYYKNDMEGRVSWHVLW